MDEILVDAPYRHVIAFDRIVAGALLGLSIVNVVFVLIDKVAWEHIVAGFFVAICAIGYLAALGLQAYLAHKRKRS